MAKLRSARGQGMERFSKNPSRVREPLAVLWRHELARELNAVAELLASPKTPLAKRIRLVRSRLKRSQAILRLAPDLLQPEANGLRHRLSAIRDDLGRARDAEAMVEAIGNLRCGGGRKRRDADKAIIRAWRRNLLEQHRKAVADFDNSVIESVAASLRHCTAVIARAPRSPDEDPNIVERFRNGYRRARKRLLPRATGARPDELHRFRKAVVVHRYQLEFMLPGAADRIEELEALRRRLGKVQDLEMLKTTVRKRSNHDGECERLIRLAERRQRKHTRKAIRAARRLLDRRTSHAWPRETAFYRPQEGKTEPDRKTL